MVVHVDLPGVNKENIAVRVEQGALILEGKQEDREEYNDWMTQRRERRYGRFYRRMGLPFDVDESKTQANFQNGVLEIVLKVNWQ